MSSLLDTKSLERLRGLCLALPGSTEKEAWGDPTWRVKGRCFAMQKGNYEGGRVNLWVAATPEAQQLLVGAQPESCYVPPYVGHRGWIGVWLDGPRPPWALVEELLVEAHRLVSAPRPRPATRGAQQKSQRARAVAAAVQARPKRRAE